MGDVFDFPMTIEEAEVIYDSLVELKNTFYIGTTRHFSVEKKDLILNLIDNFGTWIDNRRTE